MCVRTLILGVNLPSLDITHGPNQNGRSGIEVALKFLVQDPTGSNAGSVQGVTESKLLKIVVFSLAGR